MRLWVLEPGSKLEAATSREYETVGDVISGSAKLQLEGQTLNLKAGDSWLVPAGAIHQYTIMSRSPRWRRQLLPPRFTVAMLSDRTTGAAVGSNSRGGEPRWGR
jgi:quercetin dioxygenase-like cupin family protein